MLGPIVPFQLITLPRQWWMFTTRALCLLAFFPIYWLAQLLVSAEVMHRHISASHLIALQGEKFFLVYAIVQTIGVALMVPPIFGASIAIERERRTLDYLLSSSLSAWEIIVGKWFPRVASAWLLLLAFSGLAMVGRMVGGIDASRVILLAISNAALVVSLSGMTVLVSSRHRSYRGATLRSFSLIFVIGCILVFAGAIRFLPRAQMHPIFLYLIHPLCELEEWIGPWSQVELLLTSSAQTAAFSQQIVVVTLRYCMIHTSLGIGCLLTASFFLRQFDQTSKPKVRPREEIRPTRTCWESFPVAWREWYFHEFASRYRWYHTALIVIIYLHLFLPFVAAIDFRNGQYHIGVLRSVYRILFAIAMSASALTCGLVAASSIGRERDRDTWISLICSPLTETQILIGKWLGALKPGLFLQASFLPLHLLLLLLQEFACIEVLVTYLIGAVACVSVSAIGIFAATRFRKTSSAMLVTLMTTLALHGAGAQLVFPIAISASKQFSPTIKRRAQIVAGIISELATTPRLLWWRNERDERDVESEFFFQQAGVGTRKQWTYFTLGVHTLLSVIFLMIACRSFERVRLSN